MPPTTPASVPPRRLTHARFAALALLLAGGCTGTRAYLLDVRDDLEKLRHKQGPPVRVGQPLPAIDVRVLGSASMSSSLFDGSGGVLLPVPQLEERAADRGIKRALNDDPRLIRAWVWRGMGDAITDRLRYHLARYFAQARVELSLDPRPAEGVVQVVPGALRLLPTGLMARQFAFRLTANGLPPGPIHADGISKRASGAGHLAWQIPIILIHGIWVGLLITLPASVGIAKGLEEKTALDAIDKACAALAERLAQSAASAPPIPEPGG